MMLASVTGPGRGMTDDLIAMIVGAFQADGLRLAGVARAGPVDPAAHPCDMHLRVLPDGRRFRLGQRLGPGAARCRLDGGVIETVAAAVEARLCNADLLVVNKFGKQEALGRGLCPAIATAVETGVPTLVGVNRTKLPAFEAFAAGMAVRLAPDLRAVRRWFDTAALATWQAGAAPEDRRKPGRRASLPADSA